MNSFANYLIEKKIISYEQFIEASLFQESQSRGIIEIISRTGILSPQDLSEVIVESSIKQEHVFKILNERHPDRVNSVIEEWKNVTPGLIDSLAHLEISSVDELERHYTDYQDSTKQSDEPAEEDHSQLSPAALESLRELGMDIGEIEETPTKPEKDYDIEYLNYFNESRRDQVDSVLKKCIESLSTEEDFHNYINTFYKELHLLKGAARLDNLKISNKLIDQLEACLTDVIEGGSAGLDLFSHHQEHFEKGLGELWELRVEIVSSGQEISYWKNESKKSNFLSLMKALGTKEKIAA